MADCFQRIEYEITNDVKQNCFAIVCHFLFSIYYPLLQTQNAEKLFLLFALWMSIILILQVYETKFFVSLCFTGNEPFEKPLL